MKLTRRDFAIGASASAVTLGSPFSPGQAHEPTVSMTVELVPVTVPRVPISAPFSSIRLGTPLRACVELLRTFNAEAADYYRLTGDTEPIKQARRIARHKFGFYLGVDAKDDRERALFLEADSLIGQLLKEFPSVPWDSDAKERLVKLRTWAQAGGQCAYVDAGVEL